MARFLLLICLIFIPSVASALEFSEIAYDIVGTDTKREWVEIHNNTPQAIDLTGWLFFDGSYHRLTAESEFTLASGAYAVLASDAASFTVDYPSYQGLLIDTVMNLPNYSASRVEPIKLALTDSAKQSIAEILYLPTKRGSLGYTLELKADGRFADSSMVGGSPGSPAPPPPVYSGHIQLSEFLANPAGIDTDAEWVELYNAGTSSVALDNWLLADRLIVETGVKKQAIKSGVVVEAGGYAIIKIEGTLLKNQNGILNLYWPSGELVDAVTWEEVVKDDISYAKIDGRWQLTSNLTPGRLNEAGAVESEQKSDPTVVSGKSGVSSAIITKPQGKSPSPSQSDSDKRPFVAGRPPPLAQRAITSPAALNQPALVTEKLDNASPLAINKVAGVEVQNSGREVWRDRLMIAVVVLVGLVYAFHQAILLRLQRWRERFWPRLIT